MPTINDSQRPLSELLAELEAAIRTHNRIRAVQLEQTILQRLASDAHERADIERSVRALMAELERAPDSAVKSFDPFNLERSATPVDDGWLYPVWFGTNRKPTADGSGFTAERHDRITRGRIEVFVPEGFNFGETGLSFWEKLKRRYLPAYQLRLQQLTRLEPSAFWADLQRELAEARASGAAAHALCFLHGYNVTFADAALRAAQIGFDLKAPATAFFSWPSRGSAAAYPADEASIEASERAITDFLVEFTTHCQADKVHIIAHSMGNRGLLRALQRIAANAATRGQVKFGQIFLAAPDVDRDLFLDLARLYTEHSERTTLYASDGDKPAHLSAQVHAAPRAGYFEPYTVAPGIDTVAVPDFDVDLLGHSYFAQAEAMLYDLFQLIHQNQAPAQRLRMMPLLSEGATVWRLRR